MKNLKQISCRRNVKKEKEKKKKHRKRCVKILGR